MLQLHFFSQIEKLKLSGSGSPTPVKINSPKFLFSEPANQTPRIAPLKSV